MRKLNISLRPMGTGDDSEAALTDNHQTDSDSESEESESHTATYCTHRRYIAIGAVSLALMVMALVARLTLVGRWVLKTGHVSAKACGGAISPWAPYNDLLDLFPITTFHSRGFQEDAFGKNPGTRLPGFVRKFDMRFGMKYLASWDDVPKNEIDPQTVICTPNAASGLIAYAKENMNKSRSDRMVVFDGTEATLSQTINKQQLAELQVYFNSIFFFHTDVSMEGVRTMPCGLAEQYLRTRGVPFLEAYNSAALHKEFGLLAIRNDKVWGTANGSTSAAGTYKVFPGTRMGVHSYEWVQTANAAMQVRAEAMAWAASDAGAAAGVDVRRFPPNDWFSQLSKYRFLITPLGTAIQSAKVVEALLMLTIPIVVRGPFRAYDDLLDQGFPIVVVDHWSDITPAKLERWWEELSPRLEGFRCRCLTTEGFWKILMEGQCK